MELQSTKTLGGIGALLMVLSPFLAVYSAILGLVGLILVLIAMKGLADYYKESGIFNNALYGVLSTIVGAIIFGIAIFLTLVDFFREFGLNLDTAWSDPTAISQLQFADSVMFENIVDNLVGLFGSLIILFIFVVVAAIFFRKSLTSLSEKTGVGLFGTTGLLLLIGAVLTIIAVGAILIWVATILLAVAFFSIKTEQTQMPPPATPTPT
jgi:uncharacterized membrane protein